MLFLVKGRNCNCVSCHWFLAISIFSAHFLSTPSLNPDQLDPTWTNPHLISVSASALPPLLPQHCPARILIYHSTYTTHLPSALLRYPRTSQHGTQYTTNLPILYDPVWITFHCYFTLCFSSSSCYGASVFRSPAISNLPIIVPEISMLRGRQLIWRQWVDQETSVKLPVISGYSTPI